MSGAADRLILLPEARPIALRPMRRAVAEVETRLARPSAPLALPGVTLSLTGPTAHASDAPCLALTLNGAPAALQASWGQLRQATGLALEGGAPEDIALTLEEALAAPLDAAEAETGLALRLTGLTAAPAPTSHPIRRTLRLAPATGPALDLPLALSLEAASHLADALSRRPASHGMPGLLLRVGLEVETTTLRAGLLKTLNPGDAIRLSDPALTPEPRLILEGQQTARAKRHDRGAEILGPWLPLLPPSERPAPMSDTTTPTADPLPDADAIEVRLSFRAGETLLPLARLKAMGPGAIIDLPQPADATVDILANGRTIGTGELIDVAGQRAVQIKTLFP